VLVLGGVLALLVSGAEAFIAWLVKPAMGRDLPQARRDHAPDHPARALGAYLLKGAAASASRT